MQKFAKFGVPAFIVVVAVLGGLRAKFQCAHASYPKAGPMPPVVGESMDEVLTRLETALEQHAPESLSHLQPGLSEEKIAELEREADLQLSDELRALFRWRNGVPMKDFTDFMPMHRFPSVEWLIARQEAGERELQEMSPIQRAAHHATVGYTGPWISVFEDGFGDGYYYDPTRRPEQGAVFYSFLESGTFEFYPSLKNLLAAIAECYEAGAYSVDAEGNLVEDYEKSNEIHAKYGAKAIW